MYRTRLKRCDVTNCLFFRDGTDPVYIIAYEDDLLVVGSRVAVDKVKTDLSVHFAVTNLGPCYYFLGIKTDQSESGMFLSQAAYAA